MGQAISRALQAEEMGLEKPLAVSGITKTSSISWATHPSRSPSLTQHG